MSKEKRTETEIWGRGEGRRQIQVLTVIEARSRQTERRQTDMEACDPDRQSTDKRGQT